MLTEIENYISIGLNNIKYHSDKLTTITLFCFISQFEILNLFWIILYVKQIWSNKYGKIKKNYGAIIISKLVWWKWTCWSTALKQAFPPVKKNIDVFPLYIDPLDTIDRISHRKAALAFTIKTLITVIPNRLHVGYQWAFSGSKIG